MPIKRYIIRKDGRRQRYYFKSTKSFKKKYVRLQKEKGHFIYQRNIRDEIINMFDKWAMSNKAKFHGYDNMHFRKDLLDNLNEASYNVESSGVIQINSGYKKNVAPKVKLRYNPKQHRLSGYIMDSKLLNMKGS